MILYTDGGARGNPGPAAVGVVITDKSGKVIKEIGKYIGKATNNVAEYKAVIEGLHAAIQNNIDELTCYSDSLLIVKQLSGEYKIKNKALKELWDKIKILETKFKNISYHHITRDKNERADFLVNEVLDA